MTEKTTKGYNIENSDLKVTRGKIKGMDEGVSAKSSTVDSKDLQIENIPKKNSKNKRDWWIIIGAISGMIMVLLTVYGLLTVNSNDNSSDIKETSVETDDMRVATGGSAGIRVVGSTNVTSTNNTIIGFDTGIEVINSRNVSSTDDTIISP